MIENADVDPSYSWKIIDALRKEVSRPGFTLFLATGHFSWLDANNDPMMMDWLFEQHKKRKSVSIF